MTKKLLLEVEVIPHEDQRYRTAGDWQIGEDGAIHIKVSDTGNIVDALLIGMHEAVEAILCREHGIEERDVDEFDRQFGEWHDISCEEPGEDPRAPYFKEHAIADVVERLLALQMGVPWAEYSNRVDGLFKEKNA